jgi:hypothetical protein
MPDNLYCEPCRLLLRGELSVISHFENGVCFNHHDDYESFNTAMHLPCAICSLAYTYAKNSPCAVSWVKLVGYYHCWGDRKPLTLYADRQSAMYAEINMATLPKTFQDAISVTRRLRIQYLWIDSL